MERRIAVTAWTSLVLMPLFFSSNMVIGRAAVAAVEPWTLAFWRWIIAFLILLPVVWTDLVKHRAALVSQWPWILLLGFLGMWICGGIVYLSLKETTATNGTLIYTSSPIFIMLFEFVFRGQRPSLRRILGTCLALLGIASILFRGDIGRLRVMELNAGDVGILSAALAWAAYSVLLQRKELERIPSLVLFAATAIAGAAIISPFVLWEFATLGHFPATSAAWTSIFGLAFVSSVLAYSTYQYGVRMVGPTVTSIFMYLLPAYGVLLAMIFLGEELEAYHVAGFLLVMAGVAFATAPTTLWRRLTGAAR